MVTGEVGEAWGTINSIKPPGNEESKENLMVSGRLIPICWPTYIAGGRLRPSEACLPPAMTGCPMY